MKKNYFIAFEGIDGCGKDTQLNKFIEIIKEDNNYVFGNKYSNIWVTREPTKITKSGIKVSNLLKTSNLSKEDATKYFIADRQEHSILIRQILKHSHILTSRYDLSTFIYQLTQGMDFEKLYNLHNYENNNGVIIPDLTIVFDLPVEIAFNRMKQRNSQKEFFEEKDFQEKLIKNLKIVIKKLQEKDNRKIIRINANQTIENVTKEMIEKISNFLPY